MKHLDHDNSRSIAEAEDPDLSMKIKDESNVQIQEAAKYIQEEAEYTPEEYGRLRCKIDWVLMPLLMITYGLQYADKQSLASGVLFGLREDTHLKNNEYNNLSALFYLGYGVAQIPLSWLIQRFPIGKALSTCIILWGAMVMILGACNNYAQLVSVRVLLGIFESVIIPGFILLVSSWYLREEQTLRQCFYYSMNMMFSMISSVCIYFLAKSVEEKGGMAGWRVINLFLGGITVFVGILDFIIIGSPKEAWWLTKRERDMAHARIVSNATGGGEQHPWKWSQVKECFQDPQYWFYLGFNTLTTIPNGGFMAFGNLINKSFGFTPLETILYQLPAMAVGFVFVIVPAFCVHYYPKTRFPWAIFCQMLVAAVYMYGGLAPIDTPKWTKWSVFLFSFVLATGMFLLWPLTGMNFAGRTKKSWAGATALITYCIGNIVGAQIFLPSDAPRYTRGLTACAAAIVLNCVLMVCWCLYYRRENTRRDRVFATSGMTTEEAEYQRKLAGEMDMTDIENVHFRYTW